MNLPKPVVLSLAVFGFPVVSVFVRIVLVLASNFHCPEHQSQSSLGVQMPWPRTFEIHRLKLAHKAATGTASQKKYRTKYLTR